jgi:hypothetical protein
MSPWTSPFEKHWQIQWHTFSAECQRPIDVAAPFFFLI